MTDAESAGPDDASTEDGGEVEEEPGNTGDGAPGEATGGAGNGDAGETAEAATDLSETEELAARVAAVDEALATEVAALAQRAAESEATLAERDEELADLESRLKRTRADFQNYKKRVERREEQLRERATEELVTRLLDVRDNLARALGQDVDAEIRDGVEATLASFDRTLEDEGVSAIEPEPGDEVDPTVHEVVLRVEGDRPEGAIEEVYRPGYELGDRVLRPAQVTVSEGAGAADDGDDE